MTENTDQTPTPSPTPIVEPKKPPQPPADRIVKGDQ